MRLRKRRSADEGHEGSTGIDLAPMLDFVVNLLIFFIITAVFVKESGLTVNRPTSFETPPENQENKTIQIQILDNGEVWVDNRAVDVRAALEDHDDPLRLLNELGRIGRAEHDLHDDGPRGQHHRFVSGPLL